MSNLGVAAGAIAVGLNGFRTIVGVAAGVFVEGLNGLRKIVGVAAGAIAVGLNGFRTIVGVAAGFIAALVYGVLGGGFTEFNKIYKDVYTAVGGETTYTDAYTSVSKAVGGETAPGSLYAGVSTDVGGETTYTDAYTSVSKAVGGGTDLGSIYTGVYTDVGGTKPFGELFTSINRSTLFGDKAYMEQGIASEIFEELSGYKVEGGFSGAYNQIGTDFQGVRGYTDAACSGTDGFLVGLVGGIACIPPYATGGVIYGFTNSGLPGAVVGLGNGVYKAVTLPFRNAYRTFNQENTTEELTIFALIQADWGQLKEIKMDPWEDSMPESHTSASDTYTVLRSDPEKLQKSRLVAKESSTPGVFGSYKLITNAGVLGLNTTGSESNPNSNTSTVPRSDPEEPQKIRLVDDEPTHRGPTPPSPF